MVHGPCGIGFGIERGKGLWALGVNGRSARQRQRDGRQPAKTQAARPPLDLNPAAITASDAISAIAVTPLPPAQQPPQLPQLMAITTRAAQAPASRGQVELLVYSSL